MEIDNSGQVIDHINRALQDYDMSVESMMIDGLTRRVREGEMTEDYKQHILNEYIDARNNGEPSLVKQIIDSIQSD